MVSVDRLAEVDNPAYAIENDDGETVRVRETFDLTDPKCPAILYRTGTWPLERVEGAVSVVRVFPMSRQQAVALGFMYGGAP